MDLVLLDIKRLDRQGAEPTLLNGNHSMVDSDTRIRPFADGRWWPYQPALASLACTLRKPVRGNCASFASPWETFSSMGLDGHLGMIDRCGWLLYALAHCASLQFHLTAPLPTVNVPSLNAPVVVYSVGRHPGKNTPCPANRQSY